MVNPTPAPNSPANSQIAEEQEVPPTPLRCFTGAVISAAFATGMYFLTKAIHESFINTPIPNSSPMATNIATAVRTLVLGVSTLGMVTFSIATIGLLGLAIQLLVQSQQNQPSGTPPGS